MSALANEDVVLWHELKSQWMEEFRARRPQGDTAAGQPKAGPRTGRRLPANGRPAAADERRRHRRFRTSLVGHVKARSRETFCHIVDLSLGGALIELVEPLARGRKVTLALDRFGTAQGRIVWSRGTRIALRFEQKPEEISWLLGGFVPKDCALYSGR